MRYGCGYGVVSRVIATCPAVTIAVCASEWFTGEEVERLVEDCLQMLDVEASKIGCTKLLTILVLPHLLSWRWCSHFVLLTMLKLLCDDIREK